MRYHENWKVEYDTDKGEFSIDFGDRFSINWTDAKTIESFLKWRLKKIAENDI